MLSKNINKMFFHILLMMCLSRSAWALSFMVINDTMTMTGAHVGAFNFIYSADGLKHLLNYSPAGTSNFMIVIETPARDSALIGVISLITSTPRSRYKYGGFIIERSIDGSEKCSPASMKVIDGYSRLMCYIDEKEFQRQSGSYSTNDISLELAWIRTLNSLHSPYYLELFEKSGGKAGLLLNTQDIIDREPINSPLRAQLDAISRYTRFEFRDHKRYVVGNLTDYMVYEHGWFRNLSDPSGWSKKDGIKSLQLNDAKPELDMIYSALKLIIAMGKGFASNAFQCDGPQSNGIINPAYLSSCKLGTNSSRTQNTTDYEFLFAEMSRLGYKYNVDQAVWEN